MYKKVREQAEESVFQWRTEHDEWEDVIEFDSYDPNTNAVYVKVKKEAPDRGVVRSLESSIRSNIGEDVVVGVIDPRPEEHSERET